MKTTHAFFFGLALLATPALAIEKEYDFRKDLEIVHRADWRDPAAAPAEAGELSLPDGVATSAIGSLRKRSPAFSR